MSWNEILYLVTRAQAGDRSAYGQLVERFQPGVYALALSKLRNPTEAQELTQEVFIHAMTRLEQLRDAHCFVSWLRQILAAKVANLVRHYLGTQGRDVRVERELAAALDNSSRVLGHELAASLTSPSQAAARREQAVLLANALGRLPEDYRDVIVLRNLEGLTFPEVAKRMGRTQDSVEKLWLRGLARLREFVTANA